MQAFLAVSGQWRTAGGGFGGVVWIGLDHAAMRAGFEMAGITVTPALFEEIGLIEAGAREVLNNHGR